MGALDGKTAIVTGAGRGIGRAEALLLASEGAAVVVNDVGGDWDGAGSDDRPAQQVVDEITGAGGTATANHDDISSWDGAGRVVAQAVDEHGRIDILVNNAGILRDRVIVNMTEDDWDSVIRVHMKGHAAMIHHVANHWRARSKTPDAVSGRIINTASESGFFGNMGQFNYAAAKAGIAAMTMVAARELKRYNVTANCIAPRARTRMITESLGDEVMAAPEEGFDQFAPENVAPLVAFLATDAAAHISGNAFVVFGGTVILERPWAWGPQIEKNGRWTLDQLAQQIDKVFDGGPSALE
jgi:NAD(P)-dependent dehydrogenase (short-subunit alcohol dehydrogenase family)